ncbi:MAG: class I SAM-dependent methyltransferase [Vicinamibacterales bacterium]
MHGLRNAAPRLFFAVLVCLVSAGLVAGTQARQVQQAQKPGQQTQKPKYEPEVGQEGKDVVWVPTSETLVQKMLDIAKVTPGDYLIDLGSGDGRTVIAAAKRGATALGVEFNPDMVQLSRDNAAKEGVSGRATFVHGDLFEADLSKATVITMFLLPDINMKLRPKLLELEPGTRIVSNSFNMEDWIPDAQETVEEGCQSWCTALLWIVPAKVGGLWKLNNGTLALTQQFQMLSGTITVGSTSMPIAEGRLRGTEISFTADGTRYTGKVNGSRITGTTTNGTTNRTWSASR